MEKILEEIEDAANRCKAASAKMADFWLHAASSDDPYEQIGALLSPLMRRGATLMADAPLKQCTKDVIDAREHVRTRIVPLLDAVLRGDQPGALRAKHSAIKDAFRGDVLKKARAMALKKVNEVIVGSKVAYPDNVRMLASSNLIAEVVYAGVLAWKTLPKLSDDLAYIAMYVRAKNAHAAFDRKSPDLSTPEKGDIIITNNISGSTIGAIGQGDSATVAGNVSVTNSVELTPERHKGIITKAQNALNVDQDALEHIEHLLYEALGQFLRRARATNVEKVSIDEVQAMMKSLLDEVWAAQVARGMTVSTLPSTLSVIGELSKHPAMGEVLKKLVGG